MRWLDGYIDRKSYFGASLQPCWNTRDMAKLLVDARVLLNEMATLSERARRAVRFCSDECNVVIEVRPQLFYLTTH